MLIVYSAYEITKIDNSYFTKIENQTFLMILRNKNYLNHLLECNTYLYGMNYINCNRYIFYLCNNYNKLNEYLKQILPKYMCIIKL